MEHEAPRHLDPVLPRIDRPERFLDPPRGLGQSETLGDPSDFYDSWRCQGAGNWTGFCSHKVDTLLKAGSGELNPAKRAADFQAADKLMSATVPVFPLYQRPNPLIYKSSLLGMVNNPSNVGPTWNIEFWHWK